MSVGAGASGSGSVTEKCSNHHEEGIAENVPPWEEWLFACLARVFAARERRLRNQSAPQDPARSGPEARTGFEPVYEALQASA